MRSILTRLRRPALALLLLMAGPALAEGEGAMNDAERAAFRAEVRAYLLENPEVIFEAIQVLEQRRAEAARTADADLVELFADDLTDDGFSHVAGNPEGDITIVEFFDYRCGFCKRAHPEIKGLLAADGNIRLVQKEFPILGPDSVAISRMALAALTLDRARYGQLNDALMGHDGPLDEAAAYRIAAGLGYDIASLKTAAQGAEVTRQIEANHRLAESLQIQGTPSFVIGREIVRGFLPAAELTAAVAEARRVAAN